MSYLNNVVGYRKDLLANRSVVKKDNYVLLDPDGLVKTVIPGFENCDITVLSCPQIGASFVDYLVTVQPNGKNEKGFGDEGIETLLYVIDGNLEVKAGDKPCSLTTGGYVYCPPGTKLHFTNTSGKTIKAFLYKRRYNRIEGHEPYVVIGNANDLEWINYEDMEDVRIKDFLPKDLAFDMNFHILSFKPGASHGYIETHLPEHGAYFLSGQGMYNLDNDWVPVQKGDYIFMSAYSLQACYAVGRDEEFSYVYSKDCNRDVAL